MNAEKPKIDLGELSFQILNFHVVNGDVIKATFNLKINHIILRGFKLADKGNGDGAHILAPKIKLDSDSEGEDPPTRPFILVVTLPPPWREEIQKKAIEIYEVTKYNKGGA